MAACAYTGFRLDSTLVGVGKTPKRLWGKAQTSPGGLAGNSGISGEKSVMMVRMKSMITHQQAVPYNVFMR